MLSKLSIRTLSLLRFPHYRFSLKQEAEEILSDRNIEADSANPSLENRDKAFSYFRLLSRLFWWSASGLFFYNLYLNLYTADPTKELGIFASKLGYQPHVNYAVKYCQTKYQDFYNVCIWIDWLVHDKASTWEIIAWPPRFATWIRNPQDFGSQPLWNFNTYGLCFWCWVIFWIEF